MRGHTELAPMPSDRARSVASMMKLVSERDDLGLELDDRGRVERVVRVDDPRPRNVLGDLDVHA